MLLLQRSIGNRRRRRPLLPLGLRVVSLDSPGLVAVFLVGYRSSSVARAAGPSVVYGSRLLRGWRARSRSVVVGCGRVPAAAAGAAAARRSRGRPFFCAERCGRCSALHSGLTQAVSALLFPVSPAPTNLAFQRINRSSELRISRRGGVVCPCVRAATTLLSQLPWPSM